MNEIMEEEIKLCPMCGSKIDKDKHQIHLCGLAVMNRYNCETCKNSFAIQKMTESEKKRWKEEENEGD